MIKPYNFVGLIPTIWGIRTRDDISKNIDHLKSLSKAAYWLSNLDIPVKLIGIPEGALQGFNDEIMDADHATYAKTCAIDIPGPETDQLAEIAKSFNVYLMAQAKAKHEDWPDRFFNVGFIINPHGEIIHKQYKVSSLFPCEHSVCAHDIYDWWIEKYGNNLDAFWPVADTDIGRLSFMTASDANYPENGRGLALNGAEVAFRGSLPAPFTQNDVMEITTRARALENNMYVLSPNLGTYYLLPEEETPVDAGGGNSMVANHKGQLIGKQLYSNGSTFISATIDIEALRYHREHAQVSNWLKDIKSEMCQLLYQEEIYPKNLYLNREPYKHADYKEQVIDKQVESMLKKDIWRKSMYSNKE